MAAAISPRGNFVLKIWDLRLMGFNFPISVNFRQQRAFAAHQSLRAGLPKSASWAIRTARVLAPAMETEVVSCFTRVSTRGGSCRCTGWGSCSWTFRSELPVLLDKTRFNIQQSTLSAKGPALARFSHPAAQPCRLPNQSQQLSEGKM